MLFEPNHLGTKLEPGRLQIRRHGRGVQARMPHIGDVARKQPPRRRPVGAIVVGDRADRGPLLGIRVVTPRRRVLHAVRRIRHHQGRGHPRQDAGHLVGRRRVAAEQPVPTQRDQIPPHHVGRSGGDDRVLGGAARQGLGDERRELRVCPEGRQIDARRVEVPKGRLVPRQVQFRHPVVRHGQGLRTGIGRQVQVATLDGDEFGAIALDHPQAHPLRLRFGDRLRARDHGAVPIDEHRPARPIVSE